MHRNSQKRIYIPEAVYFITTKTKDNEIFFVNQRCCQYLWDVLNLAAEMKHCRFFGKVILLDHLHLLIQPMGQYTISDIMHFIKRHSSRNIRIMADQMEEGEVGQPRLRYFQWQSSYYDHIIRDARDFANHLEYIRMNPVKHGLVKRPEDYPWLYIDPDLGG